MSITNEVYNVYRHAGSKNLLSFNAYKVFLTAILLRNLGYNASVVGRAWREGVPLGDIATRILDGYKAKLGEDLRVSVAT